MECLLLVSVKTARQEGAHQEEFIPGALGLALAKGDEGSFEVLGHVLHALVERATSCLSCPAQLRRGIEKEVGSEKPGRICSQHSQCWGPSRPRQT